MFCQECQQRPATVHFTQIINNQKTELHLCSECARKHQEIAFTFNFEPTFSINKFFAGLLDSPLFQVQPVAAPECPNCLLTLRRLRKPGALVAAGATALSGQFDPLVPQGAGLSYTGE